VTIAVKQPAYNPRQHASSTQAAAEGLTGSGVFADVVCDGVSITCSFQGSRIQAVLCGTASASALQLMDPNLSAAERDVLSSSTLLARTALLQQQPALLRTAARVVKHRAHAKLSLPADRVAATKNSKAIYRSVDSTALARLQCPLDMTNA